VQTPLFKDPVRTAM